MTMNTLEYRLSFTTPASPGDAEQNGCWRTPHLGSADND